VPFEVLQAIADIAPDQLRRCLARLQAAEFLYEIKIFPDLEYTFKHALTHEVTYGSLVGDRRRALHARIVEAIERLYADRLDEQIDRLAHHAVRSEVSGKAVPYLYEARARGDHFGIGAVRTRAGGSGFPNRRVERRCAPAAVA
jgi:predicted ATPase